MPGASPWNGALFQPLNITVDLTIAGLSKLYVNPQTPMRLEVKKQLGMSEFTLSLMDDTGFDIEPYLWIAAANPRGGWPTGTLRWGYTAEDMERWSPLYNVSGLRFQPRVMKNYFVIELQGYLTGATPVANTDPLWGTLSEIITKYADKHRLAVTVPTYDVTSLLVVDDTTSNLVEKKFYKESNESDYSFLRRVVQNYLILPTGAGKSGYDVMHTTINGKDTLVFVHPETAPNEYEFIVQHKESTVVSWEPEISFFPYGILQAEDKLAKLYRDFGGEEVTHVYHTHLTRPHEPFIDTLGFEQIMTPVDGPAWLPTAEEYICMDTTPDEAKIAGVRVVGGPSDEIKIAFLRELNNYIQGKSFKNEAALVVLGDPQLEPGKKTTIQFFYPHSFRDPVAAGKVEHYTSGIYFIKSIVDNISGGQFTSTLNLMRYGFPRNPVDTVVR